MLKGVVQKWGAAASWRCGKAAAALAREKKDDVLQVVLCQLVAQTCLQCRLSAETERWLKHAE
jgi:hypothetical protein